MKGGYSTNGTGNDRSGHGMAGGQVMTGQNMVRRVGITLKGQVMTDQNMA